MYKEYRNGFLDGMRQCGFLLKDVSNADLQLHRSWEEKIQAGWAASQTETGTDLALTRALAQLDINQTDMARQAQMIESLQEVVSKLLSNIDDKRIEKYPDLS